MKQKQFLLIRVCDLASTKDSLAFSLLTSDIEKVGVVCYQSSLLENYLILRYLDEERLLATSEILRQKGIKTRVQSRINCKIYPLSINGLPLFGNITSEEISIGDET